jgi:hypothetical protein
LNSNMYKYTEFDISLLHMSGSHWGEIPLKFFLNSIDTEAVLANEQQ